MSTTTVLDPEDVEEQFLLRVRERLHQLESRTRGLYAETLVQTLLPGAQLTDQAGGAHDLTWEHGGEKINIAVRTSGTHNSDRRDGPPGDRKWTFNPVESWSDGDGEGRRRCWSKVAVLADHDGLDIGRGWTFYVLSKGDLEAFPAKTLTPANLARNKYAPVGPGELADAVAREAQKS